jgi:preprotein translocase subunit Sss1
MGHVVLSFFFSSRFISTGVSFLFLGGVGFVKLRVALISWYISLY